MRILAILSIIIASVHAEDFPANVKPGDVLVFGARTMNTLNGKQYGGSGVLVEGGVLTALHLLDVNAEVICEALGETASGRITKWDTDADIAFVAVEWKTQKRVAVVSGSDVDNGAALQSVGRDSNGTLTTVKHSFLKVQDTSKVRGEWHKELVVKPCFNQGRSGGGVFNADGELVGIVTSSDPGLSASSMGYATGIKSIHRLLDRASTK